MLPVLGLTASGMFRTPGSVETNSPPDESWPLTRLNCVAREQSGELMGPALAMKPPWLA